MSSDSTVPPGGTTAPVSCVYVKIYGEIMADKTLLPTMPEVAVRMRAAMNDPKYDVGAIARIVQADAGVSAYLVRMANSALFRGNAPSKDVPAAVMRLGMNLTRNVVIAHTLRSMFRIRLTALAEVMQEMWTRSARLAALSAVLAKRAGAFSPIARCRRPAPGHRRTAHPQRPRTAPGRPADGGTRTPRSRARVEGWNDAAAALEFRRRAGRSCAQPQGVVPRSGPAPTSTSC
jgi:hypothetical protein